LQPFFKAAACEQLAIHPATVSVVTGVLALELALALLDPLEELDCAKAKDERKRQKKMEDFIVVFVS
jgi:hypothetical protein